MLSQGGFRYGSSIAVRFHRGSSNAEIYGKARRFARLRDKVLEGTKCMRLRFFLVLFEVLKTPKQIYQAQPF